MVELKIGRDVFVPEVDPYAWQGAFKREVLQDKIDPSLAEKCHLAADHRVFHGVFCDGGNDEAVFEDGNVGAALENLVRGVDHGLLEGVARGLAVRSANQAGILEGHFQRLFTGDRKTIHPMPGRLQGFDATEEGRGGGGDMGEELADRDGIGEIALASPRIAGEIADSSGCKPLSPLGEGSGTGALGVCALAHGAEFHSLDKHRGPEKTRPDRFFVDPVVMVSTHERLEPRDGFGGFHATLAVDF